MFIEIIGIVLIHLFNKKLIKIPKYLPFFLINWLEGLKIMSSGHGLVLFTRLKLQEVLLYSGIYLCFLLVYYYTN